MLPLLFVCLGTVPIVMLNVRSMQATKASNTKEPFKHMIPYYEWYPMMQETIEALTLDNIELFDSSQLPMFPGDKKEVKTSGPLSNICSTANEMRQRQQPVYLYAEYDHDYSTIEVDQLLDSVKVFRTASHGVGDPIAVRVGVPVYDPMYMAETSIWKCTEHDNIRMQTRHTDGVEQTLEQIASQFNCTECEAERRDPSLKLKRINAKIVTVESNFKNLFEGAFLQSSWLDENGHL